MHHFFGKSYPENPFQIFGLPHLVVISVLLFILILMPFLRKKSLQKYHTPFRYILALVLILNELAYHYWNYSIGEWNIQKMLPFHLCSILVWLSAFMLFSKNRHIYEFAYFLGIGGAIQAFLTPDIGPYGFPHFRFFQTFISHGSIILAAVYMTVVEKYRPYWKSILRVFIILNVYMIFVFIINKLIGSNYMFVVHKPDTPSLLDVLGPWPLYILVTEVIGMITFLLLYLPFIIIDKRMAK